jgi:uncharacterized membrane protein
MAQSEKAQPGAADYGREALAQWSEAARYGMRALKARRETTEDKPSLEQRLDPTQAEKSGKAGNLADVALARLGPPGRFASKVKMGSRLVERVRGGGKEADSDAEDAAAGSSGPESPAGEENGVAAGDAIGAGAPLPVQGSIDIALPVAAVSDLCTHFEEYPQIVDRVTAVEVEDDTHFDVFVRARGREHQLSIELVDEVPAERLDWECTGELEHSGVLTFHPLAPRLTRLELTIERASEGPIEQLARIVGLPERVLAQELRRFKAVAELWEDGKEYESAEIGIPAEREEPTEGEEPEEAEEDQQTRKGS